MNNKHFAIHETDEGGERLYFKQYLPGIGPTYRPDISEAAIFETRAEAEKTRAIVGGEICEIKKPERDQGRPSYEELLDGLDGAYDYLGAQTSLTDEELTLLEKIEWLLYRGRSAQSRE